jgi:methionine salvage enolase-phosphatase E1
MDKSDIIQSVNTPSFKAGHALKLEGQEGIKREQVVQGIQKLMADDETRQRAKAISRDVYNNGFPSSSADAIVVFLYLVDAKRRNSYKKMIF